MSDFQVMLVRERLNVEAAYRAAGGQGVGGIDIFAGVTRAEADTQLGDLAALDYYAYEEMALAEMGRLVERAREKWGNLRGGLWHRLGRVAVGEASVVVAVGCGHRAEAFEACRFLIDELKKTVPIWKKEVYSREERWQGEG